MWTYPDAQEGELTSGQDLWSSGQDQRSGQDLTTGSRQRFRKLDYTYLLKSFYVSPDSIYFFAHLPSHSSPIVGLGHCD